jgi:hypothetical protein
MYMRTRRKVYGTGPVACASLNQVKEEVGIYAEPAFKREAWKARMARIRAEQHRRECELAEIKMHALISKHHG